MKNRFLVANPAGVFLTRCDSEKEVNEFISDHLKKNEKNYQLLMGRKPYMSEYQVIDLDTIPIYKSK